MIPEKKPTYTYLANEETLSTVADPNHTSCLYVCANNYVQTNFCAQIWKSENCSILVNS